MTAGQWEQFEAPAAKAMEQFWANLRGHTDEPDEIDFALANAVLNVVGPLIAEDTRDRLVAAAGEAIERGPMVDAGRLATWLRHEIAGAASQREVDAYERVLRMVEKGGGQDISGTDMTDPIHLRCPHCGGELYVETESTGGYYSEDRVDRIECEPYECGATWDRSGVALLKPRKKCETCGVSQRTADDLDGKVPPHARAFGGHCPGDPA